MNEFSQTAAQAITDFTQRVGTRQLTKQHGHELSPTRKPFCPVFGSMLADQRRKFRPRKMFEKLIKQTGNRYHAAALLLVVVATLASRTECLNEEYLEGFLLLGAA
jgi:hypothetical protein